MSGWSQFVGQASCPPFSWVATALACFALESWKSHAPDTDNAGNAQAAPTGNGNGGTLYDITPPVVSLTTQRALHSGVVTLTWAVTETGSGIAGYDIDVSVGGSAFTRWRSTTETSAVYTGQRGVIYAFRVTAVDRANNTDSAEATALAETVRKYYALAVASGAAGRRVAMRENGVVYYLHADHLGSTSLVTCGSAGGCKGTPYQGVVAEQLYMPFGEPRWSTRTLPTDFTFTGQRADATGLMYYRARYYASRVGRFASADTIVPNPANPQLLNRYSYAGNQCH